MAAYLIAIIFDEKQDKKPLYRIFNNDPNVKDKLAICTHERLVKIITSNAASLDGVTYNEVGDNFYYHNNNVFDCFPVVKSLRAHSRKMTLLRVIYDDAGLHKVILANDAGQFTQTLLSSAFNNFGKYITNAKTEPVFAPGRYATYRSGSQDRIVLYPDGALFATDNIPKASNTSSNHDKYCVGDRLFDDWIPFDYFKSEMLVRGLKYNSGNLDDVIISSLDDGVPSINIPCDAVDVRGTVANPVNDILVARIPNTVYSIGADAFKGLTKLEKVIYQPKEAGDIRELCLYNSNELAKQLGTCDIAQLVPLDVNKLRHTFNESQFSSADLQSLHELTDLVDCYNYSVINDRIFLKYTALESIDKSFNDTSVLSRETIEIPSSIKSITNSFRHPVIMVSDESSEEPLCFDFSNATSLEKMDTSFIGSGMTVVDLSHCTSMREMHDVFKDMPNLEKVILPASLQFMTSCFVNCPKLSEVIYPEGVLRVGYGCYSACPNLKEIHLPSTCKMINSSARINFISHGITVIPTKMCTMHGPHVQFADVLTGIGTSGCDTSSVDNFDFQDTISALGAYAFQKFGGHTFDMYNWAVTEIPSNCFNDSGLRGLILPKGTKKIGYQAFAGCEDLEKLFIPSSCENIDATAFKNVGIEVIGGTQLFVVKDSYAEKMFRRKKFKLNVSDTDDEAYYKISGKTTLSSDKQMMKAKLLMAGSSDPIIQEMADDAYIDRVAFYNNILNNAKASASFSYKTWMPMQLIKVMDAVKLGNAAREVNKVNIDENDDIQITDGMNGLLENPSSPDQLNPLFCMMHRLLETFGEKVEFIKSDADLPEMYKLALESKNKRYTDTQVLFSDEYCEVIKLRLEVPTVELAKVPSYVIIEIVGQFVVGMHLIKPESDSIRDDKGWDMMPHCGYKTDSGIVAAKNSEAINYIQGNFSTLLQPGDGFQCNRGESSNPNVTISGQLLPKKLGDFVKYRICRSLSILAIYHESNKQSSSAMCTAYLIDVSSGIVYKTLCKKYSSNIKNLLDLNYVHIEDAHNINDLPKKWTEDIKRYGFSSLGSNGVIDKLFHSDEILKELMTKPDAYDDLTPCFEWLLSATLQELGMMSIEKLTRVAMTKVFCSAYFSKQSKTRESLNKLDLISQRTLTDGTTVVTRRQNRSVEITPFNHTGYYVSYFDDGSSPRVDAYVHSLLVKDIVRTIVNIYRKDCGAVEYVDDKIYQLDDFYRISDHLLGESYAGIAVSRSEGGVYLIAHGHYDNSASSGLIGHKECIVLFRLKSLHKGALIDKMIYRSGACRPHMTSLEASLCYKLGIMIKQLYKDIKGISSGDRIQENSLRDLRNDILNGYPNNMPYDTSMKEFYDCCAKQRKQP